MKRTERHQLKQDEFVHWLDEATMWVLDNRRNVINVALVVLGAALLLSGLYMYRARQSETAQVLLSEALETYHAPIQSSTGAETPEGELSFNSADERYRAALETFQRVAEDFGGYPEGRQALYYVGICQLRLGELDAASETLSEVRAGERDLLYYLASEALASVNREQGNWTAAADIYRALVDDAESPLAKDFLLFELAKSEERSGNAEQALQYYERMLAEYPESQFRGDATNRSELLEFRAMGGSDTSG